MQGSTFIPIPKEIHNKNAIVNIQNHTDNFCFAWFILAGIYPVDRKHNPNRLYHYKPNLHELNTRGLSFPMPAFATSPNSKTLTLTSASAFRF